MDELIVVEVRGGIAYLTQKPKGIKVIIKDWDNAEAEGESVAVEEIYEKEEEVHDGN